ncbi:MAG: Holliday junction resolvase RuvX [Myxococcota bacterium]
MGRVLGLDVGTKTIGVAVSDETRLIASPLRTVARRSVARDVDDLASDVADRSIEAVVVGLPYELDGTEARSARLARQIGEAVRERFELPVHYVDERFTSVDAERQLIQARVSRQRRKEIIDQQAACIILQSFLDHPELDDA